MISFQGVVGHSSHVSLTRLCVFVVHRDRWGFTLASPENYCATPTFVLSTLITQSNTVERVTEAISELVRSVGSSCAVGITTLSCRCDVVRLPSQRIPDVSIVSDSRSVTASLTLVLRAYDDTVPQALVNVARVWTADHDELEAM